MALQLPRIRSAMYINRAGPVSFALVGLDPQDAGLAIIAKQLDEFSVYWARDLLHGTP